MHEGQLITKATGDSVFSSTPTTLAVLGGTGECECLHAIDASV